MKSIESELHLVETESVAFDNNNPRGLSADQIVNDPRFSTLVKSISDYGILEPLIVKGDPSKENSYFLIDGERRLRAAIAAKLHEVPVLIAKTHADGKILAYQVHMHRENWDKAAESQSIQGIIEGLKEDNPSISSAEIRRKLKEITSHKDHNLSDILKLLKYPNEIRQKVLEGNLSMSYLVQIESSFISPLKKHFPSIIAEFGEDHIRDIMAYKATKDKLVDTRFLMDHFKDVFQKKANIIEAERAIRDLLSHRGRHIKAVYDNFLDAIKAKTKVKPPKTQKRSTERKTKPKQNKTHPPQGKPVFYKEIKLTPKAQTEMKDIRANYENIADALSRNELEYISEALFCLETGCFKAGVLMIWASGISRVHDYIAQDINRFCSASSAMKSEPKSAWKYLTTNFQHKITDIEALKVNANDNQLLCYLVYEKILTVTQFNALRSDLQRRNDCAHPTDIKLSVNDTLSTFEHVYDFIFSKVQKS